MSTIRINKNKEFMTMSTYHLKDKKLSLKAKGLLSVMLSLPEDWNCSVSSLVAISKENETAIKTALNELKETNYLVITKLNPAQAKSGRFEYIYDVFERPTETKQRN